MEPSSLIPLPSGTAIRFSNPTEHDAYAPFVKNHLRAFAAGLSVPYELALGDEAKARDQQITTPLRAFAT